MTDKPHDHDEYRQAGIAGRAQVDQMWEHLSHALHQNPRKIHQELLDHYISAYAHKEWDQTLRNIAQDKELSEATVRLAELALVEIITRAYTK